MKNASACLKCGHETIWRVDPLCFFDREFEKGIFPLPVGCGTVDNPDPGFLGPPTVRKAVGKFVVYVCAECGYSEMYAADIRELAALARSELGSRVRPAVESRGD